MLRECLRQAVLIALKDIRAYYFKPPNLSWGILFPASFALAFVLREPGEISGLLPGLVAMSALFSATSMAAIVITFERRTGAMERLALAPVTPATIVAGKVLGGASFGLLVSLLLLVAIVAFGQVSLWGALLSVPVVLVAALSFSALGACVSVAVKEVFEAQTLANLFRFPMVFLSGIFVPLDQLPPALGLVSRCLPMTYANRALGDTMLGHASWSTGLDLGVLAVFALVLSLVAARSLRVKLFS